jgi:hypothetical protein
MKHIKTALYFFVTIVLFSACQKEYSLEHGGKTTSNGTWQFNDSTQLFTGNMESTYIDSSTSLNTKILHLIGKSPDGSQSFNMELYANSFTTGTYKASLFQSTFLYTSGASNIYQVSQLIGEFIVNITALSSGSISGTFSGSALNSTNKVIQITQGKFTSTFSNSGNAGGVSSGVLGDSSGTCKPVTLAGTYSQGIALDSTNSVQVQVTVATAGTYSIKTNTINGVSFSKTGTFTSAGVQSIILSGSGTPTNSGDQHFTLSYGNSQCDFKINFALPASGTLGGGGGSCTPFAIAGAYQQGIALDASNTIQIQVDIATPGNYTISTNTANGVVFSKKGIFTATGVQTILLTGSSTPVAPGVQNFTVTFGTSNCTFSLTFLPGVAPSGDYFPLTANSNWTYSLAAGTSSDSVHTAVIAYSPVFGSNTYSTIAYYDVPPTGAFDSAYYRKPGGDYFQYVVFSNIIPFDQSVEGEYIFLKDNVASGTTWTSPNINGTVSGIPVTGFIKMTILAKAVPVTIATFNFPDVIKVKYEYFITGNSTPVETDERWFAKNAGEIHHSINSVSLTATYDIGGYQIF